MGHRDGGIDRRYAQRSGFGVRWAWSLEPHTLAGPLRPLERRVHGAQDLGVRALINHPLPHQITRRALGEPGTNSCDRYEYLPYFSVIRWSEDLVHQMLVGFGRLIANKLLKFPRGTNRSSYTQLYVVFFLSGLVHFGGDFIVEKRMVYGSFNFSLLQAVAITFEDFVIYIAKRLLRWGGMELRPGGDDESWAEVVVRVIGYCWVTLWFCWTLPIRLDELSALGLGITDRKPIAQFLVDTWKQWA